ncbi:MAG: hypothetical protein ACRYG8_09290 [Janthinobacterium lividum]
MAVLDVRVLELVETLVRSRLDWLAFELISAIEAGRPVDEPEEALEAARRSIRSGDQPKARSEPQATLALPEPIPADEQVDFAAEYVEERLDAALVQLQASIETLDAIVEGTTGNPKLREAAALDARTARVTTVAVVLEIEGDRRSGLEGVANARRTFPVLRAALADWAARSRDGLAT